VLRAEAWSGVFLALYLVSGVVFLPLLFKSAAAVLAWRWRSTLEIS